MDTTLPPGDRSHLQRALELGRRGWGRVHPNPMVGCVLAREGEVVGEGWHEDLGGPHAEVNALARAGSRAEGATAFVSLEPCDHMGRTPPCSVALIRAGISRVVFGAADPGRESSGGAIALRSAGVDVVGPLLSAEEGRRENPAFFFNQEHQAPYVALKLAQSLDGRIAEVPGRRTAITGAEAQAETHRLRAGFDAVLVGSETVVVDDPLLTVREKVPCREQPTRVILDTRGRITLDANLFRDLPAAPLVIFTAEDTSDRVTSQWEGAGAEVHRVPRSNAGLSLTAVLERCWELDLRSILCEGGGRVASQLICHGLARRCYLFVAPFVLGSGGVPAFPEVDSRKDWGKWEMVALPRSFGEDVLLTFDRAV